MGTWYNKCMPKIKDIKPHLSKIVRKMKEIEGINDLYIWGSYARHRRKPDFRVKDIDIIAKTDFNSGDLIAINNKIITKICTKKYLEKEGYDPLAVKFSKNFVDFKKYNIDHWAISSDHKLLHWGPMPINRKDSNEIRKEAERYAANKTGHSRGKIAKVSEKTRKNWYNYYLNYMEKYFSDMPSGWYQSSEGGIDNLLKGAIKRA